jgi:predicted Holliday junction resolvase-like endonuclease
MCPCCGALFRLSDARLFYRSPPLHTPFDSLEKERRRLQQQEERLWLHEEHLRERAREAGRKEQDRRLRSLTTYFRRHEINLHDIRLLFNPVDYIAFRGLSEKACTAIELLDREATSYERERLERSIERTITAGRVSWLTMRIADDGKVLCSR